MRNDISKDIELEEWAAAHEKDVKEWAVQKTKEYYKNAITSNSVSIAVFILVTICFFACLAWVIDSYGENGFVLLVILGLIEAFYLVTGLAFSLPSMLRRCIVCYRGITKGNCHVVFARCVQIHAEGEDRRRDVICERLDDKTVVTVKWIISEEKIDSELGTIQCLVYVGEICRRCYTLEDARWELSRFW